MDLTIVWAAIIAAGIFIYVALDGFDLGVGMIFPFFPDDAERDLMMHSIAPIWDGNETWLVLGGAALFAAFPLAYSIALSGLYLPIIFMLVCLIFRGVSFEVRAKATRTKNIWNLFFICGSAGASFFQGVILGAYLHGIPVSQNAFSGDPFFWIAPFPFLTGLGLTCTYALLGAGYLVLKTDGDLQRRMRALILPLTAVLLAFIAVISVWTPLTDARIAERWFHSSFHLWLYLVPVAVVLTAVAMYFAIKRESEAGPLAIALLLVFLGYIGLLLSVWPYALPGSVTLWEAASPETSQAFTLVGAVVIIPIILAYTTVGYWVFRGKVKPGSAYH
ncbi:cytochrome d ubiquinol oxidase subunit II [Caballeronia sp. TF1N1]|uniref:cytochrome d ubiquinol oxidase subunit II n=1 Tax=Caballeronia sp. TF1N1 TaxID=2878153 RepID=UPI001FD50E9D|nr:cytochrome d ubiquinol oxidase subunit II [Caballeronia sp. TF1N1]